MQMDTSALPPIIGLTGRAGVGKSTAADILRNHGYIPKGFADKIKGVLNQRFGWNPRMWEDRTWKESQSPYFGCRLSYAGLEEFSPRSWAQWLGTEVGRAIFGQDIWISLAMGELHYENRYIFADVRFPNEATAIRDRGGVVIEILRDNVAPVNDHVSETPLPTHLIDYHVPNNGSRKDLENALILSLAHYIDHQNATGS